MLQPVEDVATASPCAPSDLEAPPSISMFVRLPDPDEGDVQDESSMSWQCVCDVPIRHVKRLDGDTPWRWVLFGCMSIMGTTEGVLSFSMEATCDENVGLLVELNSDMHDESALVYFHVRDDGFPSLRPVEPGLCEKRTGSSAGVPRDSDFRENIIGRDGNTCVATDYNGVFCDATHLIPLIKGDEYIRAVTNNDISSINDVRNGIFLNKTLHAGLGKNLGVIEKPNTAYPGRNGTPQSWQVHVLVDQGMPNYVLRAPVVSKVHQWPPATLFHFVYGAALLRTFPPSSPCSRQSLLRVTEIYYGTEGRTSALQRQMAELKAKQDSDARDEARTKDERRERYAARDGGARDADGHPQDDKEEEEDNDDDEDNVPFFAPWQRVYPPHIQRRFYEQLVRRAQAKSRVELENKVSAWLQPHSC